MRQRARFYVLGLAIASVAACGGRRSLDEGSGGVGRELASAGSGGTGAGAGGAGSSPPTIGTAGTGGATVTDTGDPQPRTGTPTKHRALAVTCDNERPAGYARPYELIPCPEDGGACEVPANCEGCRAACVDYTDGLGPRCVWGTGECLSDAECTAQDNGRCWDNRGHWFCTYDTCYSDATCTSGGPCACEGESGSPGNTCLPGNCQTDADCGANGYCSPTFGGCGDYSGVIAYYCHTPADTCLDDADCTSPTQGAGYCMYAPEVGHWSCGYGQCVG